MHNVRKYNCIFNHFSKYTTITAVFFNRKNVNQGISIVFTSNNKLTLLQIIVNNNLSCQKYFVCSLQTLQVRSSNILYWKTNSVLNTLRDQIGDSFTNLGVTSVCWGPKLPNCRTLRLCNSSTPQKCTYLRTKLFVQARRKPAVIEDIRRFGILEFLNMKLWSLDLHKI